MVTPTVSAGDSDARVDELFAALSHPTRRYVVRLLSGTRESVEVETVAKEVSAEVPDDPVPADTIEARLVHSHLPKLDEAGLVSHDECAGSLEPTEETVRAGGLVQVVALWD